jgi:hypothetical protein
VGHVTGLGNVQRFRGGLVFKAHRLLHHSILGLRVIQKKQKDRAWCGAGAVGVSMSNPGSARHLCCTILLRDSDGIPD